MTLFVFSVSPHLFRKQLRLGPYCFDPPDAALRTSRLKPSASTTEKKRNFLQLFQQEVQEASG